ncbi:hypothetical protein Hanom_Chr06g00500121 [Helianthus anomalus]
MAKTKIKALVLHQKLIFTKILKLSYVRSWFVAHIAHYWPGFGAIYVPFLHLHCFASRRMFSAAEGVSALSC